jgi:hypothetical protein
VNLDRHLAAAIFATHGVLDGTVTLGAVLVVGPHVEANPLLSTAMQAVGPVAAIAAKVAVAASLAAVSWRLRDFPGWRVWAASLALSGLAVVVNNLAALRGVLA